MTPVLAQLYALRSQLDAAIFIAETEAGAVVKPQEGACPFCGDVEHQLDLSTLDGTVRTKCGNCQKERDGR